MITRAKGMLKPSKTDALQVGDVFRSSALPPDYLLIAVNAPDNSGSLWTLVFGPDATDRFGDAPHYWPVEDIEDKPCFIIEEPVTVRAKVIDYRVDTVSDAVTGGLAISPDGDVLVRVKGLGNVNLMTGERGKAVGRLTNYKDWELFIADGDREVVIYRSPDARN